MCVYLCVCACMDVCGCGCVHVCLWVSGEEGKGAVRGKGKASDTGYGHIARRRPRCAMVTNITGSWLRRTHLQCICVYLLVCTHIYVYMCICSCQVISNLYTCICSWYSFAMYLLVCTCVCLYVCVHVRVYISNVCMYLIVCLSPSSAIMTPPGSVSGHSATPSSAGSANGSKRSVVCMYVCGR